MDDALHRKLDRVVRLLALIALLLALLVVTQVGIHTTVYGLVVFGLLGTIVVYLVEGRRFTDG